MDTHEPQTRFQALVEEHRKILYKVCNAYCKNQDDRDDLTQEIIFQLWRSFGTFDSRCQFATWMYRIALNVAISFYRRESSRTQPLVSTEQPVLERLAAKEDIPPEIQALYVFIEGQDPLNRALLLLYLDGYGYKEIAEVLGIRETNVATKISRLKKTIQQEFSTTEEGEVTHGTGRDERKMGGIRPQA